MALLTNSFVRFYTARVVSRAIFSGGSLAFLFFASLEAYGVFMFVVQQATALGRFALGATSETFLQDRSHGAYAFPALLLMITLFLLFSSIYYFSQHDEIVLSASIFFTLGCFTWVRIYGVRSLVTMSISHKSAYTGLYEVGISIASCGMFYLYYVGSEIAMGVVTAIVILVNSILIHRYKKKSKGGRSREFLTTSAAINVGGASSAFLRFVDRSILMVILGPIGFGIFSIGLLASNLIAVPLKMSVDYLFRFKEAAQRLTSGTITLAATALLSTSFFTAKLLGWLSFEQLNFLLQLLDKSIDTVEQQLIILLGFSYGIYVLLSQLTATFLKLNNEFITMPLVTLIVALATFWIGDSLRGSEDLFLQKIQYQYLIISVISIIVGMYFARGRTERSHDGS